MIDVKVLGKSLREHFGAVKINLDPVGRLYLFWRSLHMWKHLSSLKRFSSMFYHATYAFQSKSTL